jgi:WD40 repeat protein
MKVYISAGAKRLVIAALCLFPGRSMGGRKLVAGNAAMPAAATAAAAGASSASVHKLKVFISYSRTDLDFAERLVAALEARNIEALIDKRDLPLLEEWQRELAGFIRKADAVVYLVSSASIGSRWCEWEIAQVIALNKRLAPIVVTTLAANEPIPDSVAKINFLFFTPPNDFDAQADKLAKALGTDLSWLKDHTRLGEDAARWNENGRLGAMLLRGEEIAQAERWMLSRPREAPPPTELQTRYIMESRRGASRRRLAGLGTAAVVLLVVAILGTLYLVTQREAGRQQTIATARRLTSAAELLRDQPPARPDEISPLERSLQLAAEAMQRLDAIGFPSLDADIAMRRGLDAQPRRLAWRNGPYARGAEASFDKVVFSDDGVLVAAQHDARVKIAIGDIASRTLHVHEGGARADQVELSPDGRFLATVGYNHVNGAIDVFDLRAPEPLAGPVARVRDLGSIEGIALAPAAKYLAVTRIRYDEKTREWERNGTDVFELARGQDARNLVRLPPIGNPSFSPDGIYLAGILDATAVVWSVERLRSGDTTPAVSMDPTVALFPGVLFSPDGKYLALQVDGGPVQIRTVGDWKLVREVRRDGFVALGLDARFIAGWSEENATIAHVIDTETGEVAGRFTASWDHPAVAFGPGGDVVALGTGPDLWRIAPPGSDTARIQAAPGTFTMAFGPDETRLATFSRPVEGSDAGLVAQIWDVASGKPGARYDLGAADVLGSSADGQFIGVGSAGEARVIALNSGRTVQRFTFDGTPRSLALSPNGAFMVVETKDDVLRLWQVTPATDLGSFRLTRMDGAPTLTGRAAIASNGQTIVAEARHTQARRVGLPSDLRVWNPPAQAEARVVAIGGDRSGFATTSCALSDDAQWVAINLGVAVRVRNIASGRDLVTIDGTSGCQFSPDGRQLGLIGLKDTVRVWDVGTQSEIARIETLPGVKSLLFSPRGRYLATLQDDGTVRIWLLRGEDLVAEVCSRLTRNLTADEWRSLFGGEPYQATCPGLEISD